MEYGRNASLTVIIILWLYVKFLVYVFNITTVYKIHHFNLCPEINFFVFTFISPSIPHNTFQIVFYSSIQLSASLFLVLSKWPYLELVILLNIIMLFHSFVQYHWSRSSAFYSVLHYGSPCNIYFLLLIVFAF